MRAALCLAGLLTASCAGTTADISRPGWAALAPSAKDYANVYPVAAVSRGISGQVYLLCTILADRTLDCAVQSESPPGVGFGAAAMVLSRAYTVVAADADRRLATGSKIRVPFRFALSP